MADPLLAEIKMFGGNFAPRDWSFCDGQLLSIAQNTALFSLLGTFYGGDGRTTFALPDMRGRVAVHEGTGPGLPTFPLGSMGGQVYVTLTASNLPAHSHAVPATVGVGTHDLSTVFSTENASRDVPVAGDVKAVTTNPAGTNLARSFGDLPTDPNKIVDNAVTGTIQVTVPAEETGYTGSGQDHYNLQPYLVVNYIIARVGIFPSRN